jgi:phage FluMu gp28-like protein
MQAVEKIGRSITEDEWLEIRASSLSAFPESVLAADNDNLPAVLLTYQQKLLKTTADNAVTIYEKSRRTGVTWAAAADAVLTAGADKNAGGMDAMYIGYNLDMAREFIDTAAMWAKAFVPLAMEVEEFLFKDQNADGDSREIGAFRIRFASGFEIIALTSKPRSLRGRQGYVIIDEAAFHDALDELVKAAMALLMWGGKVLIISTHDGDGNHFNELIKQCHAGEKPYAVLRTDLDDALKQGLYERICLVTGKEWSLEGEAQWRAELIGNYGDAADEELFCIPSAGSGSWLTRSLIEARMTPDFPVVRLERKPEFSKVPEPVRYKEIEQWCEENLLPLLQKMNPVFDSFFGQDFARHVDVSCIVPGQLTQTLKRIIPFIVEMRQIPFAQQRQVLFYIVDNMPRFKVGAMDAGGNGANLAEDAADRYGHEIIHQIKLSVEWYRTEMPPLKTSFEDDEILLPKDRDVVTDHAMIKLVDGVPRIPNQRIDGTDKKKRHGDTAIGTALFHFATRQQFGEYAYDNEASLLSEDRPFGRDDDYGSGIDFNRSGGLL